MGQRQVKASPADGRPRPLLKVRVRVGAAYSEGSHEDPQSRRHRAARQNLERSGDPAEMIAPPSLVGGTPGHYVIKKNGKEIGLSKHLQ